MAHQGLLVVDGGLKVETFKLFCREYTIKTTTVQPLMGSNSQDSVPLDDVSLESPFAVRSDSNRHRFEAI